MIDDRSSSYTPSWGADDFSAMDADEFAIRSILHRVFSLGRRHRWKPGDLVDAIDRKRSKILGLIEKYRDQAAKGRATI